MTATTHEQALPRTAALSWGLLAGVLAWKLQLMVNYALIPYACWRDASILIHAASLLTFLTALTGAVVAWRSWQRTGTELQLELHGVRGRARFMAVSGIVLSLYFALLILGQWLPNLIIGACDGIA